MRRWRAHHLSSLSGEDEMPGNCPRSIRKSPGSEFFRPKAKILHPAADSPNANPEKSAGPHRPWGRVGRNEAFPLRLGQKIQALSRATIALIGVLSVSQRAPAAANLDATQRQTKAARLATRMGRGRPQYRGSSMEVIFSRRLLPPRACRTLLALSAVAVVPGALPCPRRFSTSLHPELARKANGPTIDWTLARRKIRSTADGFPTASENECFDR